MTDDFKFVSSSTSLFMMDESMSNLTSASGDVSASSGYAQAPPPAKKKRSLPGNPDPDAEVIALSPKSLLATNKYVCEICHKGFQRDQNLQLHRRGHNLPWKLKQRANKEVRKKVYLCPETTCVHHDPSRALGDLSGIKKHFCRKHGEKKWKCEKCSKRYAVQSDWKAHSKICGTREYRCDCGTLFSRRDSFITHRAFCDALADESARAIATQLQQPGTSGSKSVSLHQLNAHGGHVLQAQPLKREAEYSHSFNQKPDYHNILPWFAGESAAAPSSSQISHSSPLFSSNTLDPQPFGNHGQNPNPDDPTLSHFKTPTTFPHMSATALLQKAAQMGVTMSSSNKPSPSPASAVHRPHQVHMSQTNAGTTAGLGLSSCESGFVPSKAASGFMEPATAAPCSFLHDMMTSLSSGFDGSPSFGQAFIGMLNPKRPNNTNFQESNSTSSTPSKSADQSQLSRSGDSLTRDFLGLKAFSHSEFLNMVNLDHINSSSTREQQNQNQTPWH